MLREERTYLDYNATSTLSSKVLSWLREDEIFFANPSSSHFAGQQVKKRVSLTRNFLFQIFGLDPSHFSLFFHSGASEGINTLLKGRVEFLKRQEKKSHLFFLETDHSCLHGISQDLQEHGHLVSVANVDFHGNFNDQDLIQKIQLSDEKVIVNYTWVNNETGVVHDLERIARIKSKTQCGIHVDAVQSIGKTKLWKNLLPELDSYTFSGHKIGSLKGIGFSFVKKDFLFCPLLHGGGQEEGMRSGTENTLGVWSLYLALQEMEKCYDFQEQLLAKQWVEKKLLNLMGDAGEITGYGHPKRNGNTISFLLYSVKGEVLSMALDMAGFEVSNGSACRSGAGAPSHVLRGMGYSEDLAAKAVRLSFSPFFTRERAEELWPHLSACLSSFL